GGVDRLDQDGGPDGAVRDPESGLGVAEHVVPKPRLEVALELGQVVVGALPAGHELRRVVEEVETEVEQGTGHRPALELQVLLVEVPAAWAYDDRGQRPVIECVVLALGRGELEPA